MRGGGVEGEVFSCGVKGRRKEGKEKKRGDKCLFTTKLTALCGKKAKTYGTKFKVAIGNNEFKIYHDYGEFDLFFMWNIASPYATEKWSLIK